MTRDPATILMADDDLDDCEFARRALEEARVLNPIRFVHNGEQLLDYLYRRGSFTDPDDSPTPALILLDLNMPRVDGREALESIKADPRLRKIPVIALTTSSAEEDIHRSYDLGVNSYITKPVSFRSMVDVMSTVGSYWLEIVALPDSAS